ncbi:hypothetical protein [Aneurinibacillus sp. REN35]|uniref:hypothetical protein n=1 Tax=Aneurinibacillus sp. REN35 TaxID=3237286 RepID=UPI003527BB20
MKSWYMKKAGFFGIVTMLAIILVFGSISPAGAYDAQRHCQGERCWNFSFIGEPNEYEAWFYDGSGLYFDGGQENRIQGYIYQGRVDDPKTVRFEFYNNRGELMKAFTKTSYQSQQWFSFDLTDLGVGLRKIKVIDVNKKGVSVSGQLHY